MFADKPAQPLAHSQAAQLQHQVQAAAHAQAVAQRSAVQAQAGAQGQANALGQAAAQAAALAKQAIPGQLPAMQPGQPTPQQAGQLAVAVNAGPSVAGVEPPAISQMVSTASDVGDPGSAAPRMGASGVLTKSTESFKVH